MKGANVLGLVFLPLHICVTCLAWIRMRRVRAGILMFGDYLSTPPLQCQLEAYFCLFLLRTPGSGALHSPPLANNGMFYLYEAFVFGVDEVAARTLLRSQIQTLGITGRAEHTRNLLDIRADSQ